MKVVINASYGGFHLSAMAIDYLAKKEGKQAYFFRHSYSHYGDKTPWEHLIQITLEEAQNNNSFIRAYSIPNPNDVIESHDYYLSYDFERNDPRLIDVVETLGKLASEDLKIVDVPDDVEWYIEEYDGYEHVAEKHRTWS